MGYLLGYGVRRWYPQFDDAIVLLPLFLGIGVLRVSDFWSSFLLITGLEERLLRVNVAAALTGALAWALVVRPWSGETIAAAQVGWLAALLTLSAYAATAAVSLRARRV